MGKDYEAGGIVFLACGLTLAGNAHLHQDCLPDLCQLRAVHHEHGHEREPAPEKTAGGLIEVVASTSASISIYWFVPPKK